MPRRAPLARPRRVRRRRRAGRRPARRPAGRRLAGRRLARTPTPRSRRCTCAPTPGGAAIPPASTRTWRAAPPPTCLRSAPPLRPSAWPTGPGSAASSRPLPAARLSPAVQTDYAVYAYQLEARLDGPSPARLGGSAHLRQRVLDRHGRGGAHALQDRGGGATLSLPPGRHAEAGRRRDGEHARGAGARLHPAPRHPGRPRRRHRRHRRGRRPAGHAVLRAVHVAAGPRSPPRRRRSCRPPAPRRSPTR